MKKKHLLLIYWLMKTSFFGLTLNLLAIGMLMASEGNAQQAPSIKDVYVSVNQSDATVKDVFKEIEKKTNYTFSFESSELDVQKRVNLRNKRISVRNLLYEVARESGLNFKQVNWVINVSGERYGNADMSGSVVSNVFQDRTVSGRVVSSEDNEGLPGVNVIVKGTSQGTVTDVNGDYKLQASSEATLVYSSVGYLMQEVSVGDQSVINMTMQPDVTALEEVVVVGYGTMKKSDFTGSIGTFEPAEAKGIVAQSVDQLLQGQVAGLQYTAMSGEPGAGASTIIRGGNSLNGGNQALFVVDGFPLDNTANSLGGNPWEANAPMNPLAYLDPNDIESVQVLKDASATAIYGTRGANGVIIITTKKGKNQKTVYNASISTDISTLMRKVDLLNATEWGNYVNERAMNDGQTPTFRGDTAIYQGEFVYDENGNPIIPNPLPENLVTTDWQDEMYRTAVSKGAQFSMRGGSEKTTFALSFNYLDQQGIVKNTFFNRASGKINLDHQANRMINFGTDITLAYISNGLGVTNANEGTTNFSLTSKILTFKPWLKTYDGDGTLNDEDFNNSPIPLVETPIDRTQLQIMPNAYINVALTDYLDFKVSGGLSYRNETLGRYWTRDTWQGANNGGQAIYQGTLNTSWLIENTLTFEKTFNDIHRINAVAGATYQEFDFQMNYQEASNFVDDQLSYWGMGGGADYPVPRLARSVNALGSYLLRINYSFDDRYLITFSGRSDGATKFVEGNKWGTFPSVALAWRLSEEDFMQTVNAVDEFKLRGSWGITGNQAIPAYATQTPLQTRNAAVMGRQVGGLQLGNPGNPHLIWESTEQINVGLDLGFMQNRLRFTADAYHKVTRDLLQRFELPASSGVSAIWDNVGEIENRGIEFTLGADIIAGRSINWSMNGNLSMNRNKILDLGQPLDANGNEQFFSGGLEQWSGMKSSGHINRVGQPVGMIFGYVTDGIYQNAQEIEDGFEPSKRPGFVRVRDINGDSTITADDRVIIGNPYPDLMFGFTNSFSYKNFTLSVFVTGQFGNDLIWTDLNRMGTTTNGGNILKEVYDGRWTGEGTSNYYPIASGGQEQDQINDMLIEDGSFVRLKNVSLSYAIPTKNWNLGLSELLLRASVTNPNLIWTNFRGYDPETTAYPFDALRPGVVSKPYPTATMYRFEVNVTF
jgi:TonB-linked SusC/RagA family outer membrane protein